MTSSLIPDIPPGERYVYILRCEPSESLQSTRRSERTYRMKSKDMGESYSDVPLDFYSPRKWSRVAVYHGNKQLYPLYIEFAKNAENVYYVGSTTDVKSRIEDHISGNASKFTNYTDVTKIERIEGFSSVDNTSPLLDTIPDLVKRREEELGRQLNNGNKKEQANASFVDLDNLHSFAHFDTNEPNMGILL